MNLRWNDETGLRTNPRKWQTLKRLFAPATDVQFNMIEKNNIALCLMSHMMLLASGKLTQAFGTRLKFIEVVRHPVDLVASGTNTCKPMIHLGSSRFHSFVAMINYLGSQHARQVSWTPNQMI